MAEAAFGRSSELGDMAFKFSGHEPMINVYEVGGKFEPHEDGHDLTVLVPLTSPNDHEQDACVEGSGFDGGGTGFWADGVNAEEVDDPSVVLRPPAGTALLWRGHVMHAALPVTRGRRHAFVCSFNLTLRSTADKL